MSKNIFLCSDGTGNTTIKGRGTNVFKLFEAVDINTAAPRQLAFYDDGIGTQRGRWRRALAGATGYGLGRNVKHLYLELVRVYEPGDRLLLFGFSRGAFTVRMLGQMIVECGILAPSACDPDLSTESALTLAVDVVYRSMFLGCTDAPWFSRFVSHRLMPSRGITYKFHSHDPIDFIGVWDTVDAVGMPVVGDVINRYVWRFKPTNCDESDHIRKGCHALALDEDRRTFTPLLWAKRDNRKKYASTIEQVWFPGAHSNVGGGYPRQGLSLISLEWMMKWADLHGARFLPVQAGLPSFFDRLYEPRTGLGLFYRWQPRDIQLLCNTKDIDVVLHSSVLKRLAYRPDGYAPPNIPASFVVDSADSREEARRFGEIIKEAYEKEDSLTSLLEGLLTAVDRGRFSYSLFVAGAVGGVFGVIWLVLEILAGLRGGMFPLLVTAISLGLLLASAYLASLTDSAFDRICSGFWHSIQRRLLEVYASE